MTHGLYRIGYADPAWKYADACNAGQRGAEHKYTVTSTEDLCRLEVGRLFAADAALFIWATWPMLPDALRVMEAWGFRYSTCAFVWVKTTKGGALHWGMGQSTRSNTEPCLLGIRGRLGRESGGVHQVIAEPETIVAPVGAHSAKPTETRDRIVRLLGDRPRIELFARDRAPGWDAWGNQVPGGSDVEIGMRASDAAALAPAVTDTRTLPLFAGGAA